MDGVLPALHAALVPLRRALSPHLHLFSTEVVRVRGSDFDRGRLATTGGTSITPVLEHALAQARGRRGLPVLVLTDGWFAVPTPALARSVLEAGVRIHLGVAGTGPLHDREGWVAASTRLPSLSSF